MKRKNIFLISLCLILGFTTCDDMDFLQIKPDNLILTDDAVKNS